MSQELTREELFEKAQLMEEFAVGILEAFNKTNALANETALQVKELASTLRDITDGDRLATSLLEGRMMGVSKIKRHLINQIQTAIENADIENAKIYLDLLSKIENDELAE